MTGSRGGRRLRVLKSKPSARSGGLEHAVELAEIQGRGLAFGAQEDRGVGNAVQAGQQLGHVAGRRFVAAPAILGGGRRFVDGTRPQAAHQQGSLVADLGLHGRLGQGQGTLRIGEQAELVDPQHDVLGRRRLQGGDESAVAGHVNNRDFQGRQALQGLRATPGRCRRRRPGGWPRSARAGFPRRPCGRPGARCVCRRGSQVPADRGRPLRRTAAGRG